MKENRFSRWIFESYHPTNEGLALFRIFASLMVLFFLMPDSGYYSYLAELPDDFYTPPPGPMMLFDSFPPATVMQGLHLLLFISWMAVLAGYKTRMASLLAAFFMLALLGFIFSVGKVNHMMLLVVTPAVMAFSNWGASHSVDARHNTETPEANGWPIVLLALFIGFMMFTAGFPKILGGWLDPNSMATKGHLLNQYFVRGRTELLSGYAVGIDNPYVWGFLDWATVCFEIGFIAAVLRAGWTRLFVCFAVLFHFSTMLILNIAFLVNFPAYAAFLPWSKIYNRLRSLFGSGQGNGANNWAVLLFGGTIALLFSVIKIVESSGWFLSTEEPRFHEFVLIGGAACAVLLLGVRKGFSLILKR